jgi:hypothetical protein
MAEAPASTPSAAASASDKAKESLSQFVAKVLDQLSLSAWLPAAALVLGVFGIFQVAAVAQEAKGTPAVTESLRLALDRAAGTSIGGAVLLLVAIVVLTTITQAFSFEAIRTLEGYWGTARPVEWFAARRQRHFTKQRTSLDDRFDRLTEAAWRDARDQLEREQSTLMASDPPSAVLTPNLIAVAGARVLGRERPLVVLTDAEQQALDGLEWRSFAPEDTLRRRTNVDKRRRDLPRPGRMLPTRLGNILRAHEDETGDPDVETFIQRRFERMPRSMQVEHDEQRTRLDLYCTMVFVVGALTAAAVVAFRQVGPQFVVASTVGGLVGMWVMYRAALASARAYGLLMVTVATTVD